MALIKQASVVKPKMQKKEVTIKQSTWKMADQYMKFAGLRGSNQEKIEFLIEEALLHVFETDEDFQKSLNYVEQKKVAPKQETKKHDNSADLNKLKELQNKHNNTNAPKKVVNK